MKKNTVNISLDYYNELRDFEKEILEGKVFCLINGYGEQLKFYTNKEAIEVAENANSDLRKVLNEKRVENERLSGKVRLLEKKTNISDLESMSLWQLIKWKLSLK